MRPGVTGPIQLPSFGITQKIHLVQAEFPGITHYQLAQQQ
jgi:hypothetical protein